MKRLEQALLLLNNAAPDEALLEAVIDMETVADEVFGFHCQQAAEKLIKALLSNAGLPFQKTHNIASLMESLASAGLPLPDSFGERETFTPFGALYRYEDLDSGYAMDRHRARETLGALRIWVENQMKAT